MEHTREEESAVLEDEHVVFLDAEDLAEGGIAQAYEELEPHLRDLGIKPQTLTEDGPNIDGTYAVRCQGVHYPISGDDVHEADTWAHATFALFDIVNRQLTAAKSPKRFYAMGEGNDLEGAFLTPNEAATRQSLDQSSAHAYLPRAVTDSTDS